MDRLLALCKDTPVYLAVSVTQTLTRRLQWEAFAPRRIYCHIDTLRLIPLSN